MKTPLKRFIDRHMGAFLIGCLILSAFVITMGMINAIEKQIPDDVSVKTNTAPESDNDTLVSVGDRYVVKEYDGRIGVYLPGDTQPVRTVEIYVMYLPESDRIRLRDGIIVNGILNLETLLSDFSS